MEISVFYKIKNLFPSPNKIVYIKNQSINLQFFFRLHGCSGGILFVVRLQVEPTKEKHVHNRLNHDVVREKVGVALLENGKVNAIGKEKHKLANLNLSDISFPPEIGLHVRAKRCQPIVGVHYLEYGEMKKNGG